MTLPINNDLPFRPSQIREGGEELEKYIRDLTTALEDRYAKSTSNIDGTQLEYTPVITGSTNPGTATYSSNFGLALRQGVRTTVWFDIRWTAHTGTGMLLITLPYKVKSITPADYFTGPLQTGNFVYPAGTYAVVKASPDTFTADVVLCGSGVGGLLLTVQPAGVLIGMVQYIGQENE